MRSSLGELCPSSVGQTGLRDARRRCPAERGRYAAALRLGGGDGDEGGRLHRDRHGARAALAARDEQRRHPVPPRHQHLRAARPAVPHRRRRVAAAGRRRRAVRRARGEMETHDGGRWRPGLTPSRCRARPASRPASSRSLRPALSGLDSSPGSSLVPGWPAGRSACRPGFPQGVDVYPSVRPAALRQKTQLPTSSSSLEGLAARDGEVRRGVVAQGDGTPRTPVISRYASGTQPCVAVFGRRTRRTRGTAGCDARRRGRRRREAHVVDVIADARRVTRTRAGELSIAAHCRPLAATHAAST